MDGERVIYVWVSVFADLYFSIILAPPSLARGPASVAGSLVMYNLYNPVLGNTGSFLLLIVRTISVSFFDRTSARAPNRQWRGFNSLRSPWLSPR